MTDPQYTLIRADGTRIPIPPQGLTLGRSSQNDVVLRDSNISRRHARILLAAGRCWIRDEGSALGTLLNGKLVPGQIEFKPGDTLHLGPQAFTLEKYEAAVPITPEPIPTPKRRLKPGVAIGLGVGLVIILVAIAFITGIIGPGLSQPGYTRYHDPYNVYSLEVPESWEVEEGYDFEVYSAYFYDPAWVDEERGVMIIGAPLQGAGLLFGTDVLTPEDLLRFLVLSGELSGLEDALPDTDLRNLTLGGDPAASLETTINDGSISIHAQIVCVLSDDKFALFIAGFPQEDWEANQSIIDHMLNSLRLE
jgi:hypothetical protein